MFASKVNKHNKNNKPIGTILKENKQILRTTFKNT